MLSRARSVDGFLVLRPATKDELAAGPPAYLKEEMDRLMALEAASTDELQRKLQELRLQLPEFISNLFRRGAAEAEARDVDDARRRGKKRTPAFDAVPAKRLRRKTTLLLGDAGERGGAGAGLAAAAVAATGLAAAAAVLGASARTAQRDGGEGVDSNSAAFSTAIMGCEQEDS